MNGIIYYIWDKWNRKRYCCGRDKEKKTKYRGNKSVKTINVYTWNINANNYQNKPIYLQIEKIEDNALASAGQAVSDLVEEESSLGFVFIVVILAVLVLIVALFIKHKRGKVNRF